MGVSNKEAQAAKRAAAKERRRREVERRRREREEALKKEKEDADRKERIRQQIEEEKLRRCAKQLQCFCLQSFLKFSTLTLAASHC